MPQAKTEVALQFSERCAAEVALQHSLFCIAEVTFTKSCAAASEKLQCNIEKTALQESGAFLPLSCRFQAPTFRPPRLGPAEHNRARIPGFPTKIHRGRRTELLGRWPKMALAPEQPRLAPVQVWGCSRARDMFETLRPSPPTRLYLLARNQYISNSPGCFFSVLTRVRIQERHVFAPT